MKAMPWADEKLVARRPDMDMPAVTAAAACSDSGSTKTSGRPATLMCPFAVFALAHDDGGVAVHRHADAGEPDLLLLTLAAEHRIFSV